MEYEAAMKVLVVDDSAIYRRVIEDIVKGIAVVGHVAVASNGNEALAKAFTQQPDLITLDMEMPDISGLQVLRALRAASHRARVVVISAHTEAGTRLAIEALELGAVDVLPKPLGLSGRQAIEELSRQLRPIVQGVAMTRGAAAPAFRPATTTSPRFDDGACEIIALGASTGGPQALSTMMQLLPADFPVPILVAVHMPPGFTAHLAASLNKRCALRVLEATDGEPLLPGTINIAPAGRHLRVRPSHVRGPHLTLGDDPPVHGCRPSVDVLFHSVAQTSGSKALGALLTGMGRDGAAGLGSIKHCGGRTLAQDEPSCVVYGMPRAAVEAGVVDAVGSPEELVTYLLAAAQG